MYLTVDNTLHGAAAVKSNLVLTDSVNEGMMHPVIYSRSTTQTRSSQKIALRVYNFSRTTRYSAHSLTTRLKYCGESDEASGLRHGLLRNKHGGIPPTMVHLVIQKLEISSGCH